MPYQPNAACRGWCRPAIVDSMDDKLRSDLDGMRNELRSHIGGMCDELRTKLDAMCAEFDEGMERILSRLDSLEHEFKNTRGFLPDDWPMSGRRRPDIRGQTNRSLGAD